MPSLAWLLAACTGGPDFEVPEYVETGDLDAIEERGFLRILAPRPALRTHLPRRGFPLDQEMELAMELGERLGVVAALVPVDRHDEVLPMLLDGRGDLAVASLTETASRAGELRFSDPLSRVREQLVQRTDEPPITEVGQLAGRTIAVRKSSSYWETVGELQAKVDVKRVAVPEDVATPQIVRGVGAERYDLTVADDDIVRATRQYVDDVVSHLTLTDARPVGWAMRPDSEALAGAVDGFLAEYDLASLPSSRVTGDLPAIRERGVIRLLTRNSAATYFLHRGELMGFEYELWKAFAEEQDLRLQVVVPPSRDQLIPWLLEGKGDFVGAGLTITDARRARSDIRFTAPYHEAAEVVVTREGATIGSREDLDGARVAVRPSSSYRETLTELQEDGIDVEIVDVPEERETEWILRQVADGSHDVTLADAHIVAIEQAHGLPVEAAVELGEPRPHGVVVRESDEALRAALDDFVARVREEALYRILHERYFEDTRRIEANTRIRTDHSGPISPYDELVKAAVAEEEDLDWRLVVAQMYQESRFDPEARSWAGARGLLQLMPRTAAELGVDDPTDPEQSIEAGVAYLGDLRERFDDDLLGQDRTWLALASYNAGYGHVLDAQELARRKGLDEGRWFGNVERAMLLLMKPRYARDARYGYVRGTEPVHYVGTIRDRYQAYSVSPGE